MSNEGVERAGDEAPPDRSRRQSHFGGPAGARRGVLTMNVRLGARADIDGPMKWASSLSRSSITAEAFAEAAQALEVRLAGSTPDLLLAFTSSEHAGEYRRIAALAQRRFPASLVAGCTASGVIGDAHEAEEGPALSLTAAVLPSVALSAFHLDMTSLPPAEGSAPAAARESAELGRAGVSDIEPRDQLARVDRERIGEEEELRPRLGQRIRYEEPADGSR